ncbi:protein phosphatase 2C domain-containing protein [Gemella sp. zg-570]|uniref:protein phosphatase 2C domain-containing protein n=1 Tax=Gemella sp. zg-570 TaxID=2840371 RepID=UPI001C0D3124|nr:protein phosphatase 2C domain-containing protein [Gemella sp. zg-570]QWQ39450.1 protein phosphatase 2C domain-containing protein [Gemella sp. zg-570]
MPVVYSYSYNKGLKKKKNEDAINVVKNKQGYIISIICDGVSSHKDSAFSSDYIVNNFSKKWKKTKFDDYDTMKNWVIDNIKLLNLDIIKKSTEKNKKMATTLLVTVVFEEQILVANVGDSLAFGINNNRITEMLSKDDSFVGVLLEAGVITEEEAKVHPKRHALTQAIGISENITIHIREEELKFDYILSCSDGLTTMLTEEEITDILMNDYLSVAVNNLISEANNKGGIDNISISVFKVLRGDNDDK